MHAVSARRWGGLAVALGFASSSLLGACFRSAESIAANPQGQAYPPSTTCPPEGTEVPYGRIKAEPGAFVGCKVKTKIAFVGVGLRAAPGTSWDLAGVWNRGETSFSIGSPNEVVLAQAARNAGDIQETLLVPDALANPFYDAKTGDVFEVVGSTRAATYIGGLTLWVLAATQVTRATPSEPALAPAAATPTSAEAPDAGMTPAAESAAK